MAKLLGFVRLEEMPFDRWDSDKNQHVHATGRVLAYDNGKYVIEYEDDDTVGLELPELVDPD